VVAGEGQMTSSCQHDGQTCPFCESCVTLMLMALGVLDRATIVEVTSLADAYAEGVASSLADVESPEALLEGLSGAFISFLVETSRLVHTLQS